jgi:alkylhydroperoxidase family enzyme
MSRLKLVPMQPDDPALAAMFAEVRARGIEVPNVYRTLGHAPVMLRAWLDMAWRIRLDARTPRSLRELVILRCAQAAGVDYEWRHHVPMALAAGVSQAQISVLSDWRASDAFDVKERAALRIADEVTLDGGATADAMAELQALFQADEQVELVLTACFYACVGRFLNSFAIELEPWLKA